MNIKAFSCLPPLLRIYYLQNSRKEVCRIGCLQKSRRSTVKMSGQIDLQKVVSVLVLNELSEPTPKEIEAAIEAITAKIPNRTPLSLIQKLYKQTSLIAKKKKAASFPPSVTTSINYRNFLKKSIAKSFYYSGFGYNSFLASMQRRHSSFHIERKVYLIYSQGMVLQIYRALEAMLIRNRIAIKLKHYRKVQELCEWVLNYRKYLPLHAQVLRKLTSFIYSIDITELISLGEARELYGALEIKFQPFGKDEMNKMNSLFEEIDINFDESEDWSFKDIFEGSDELDQIAIDFDPKPNPTTQAQLQNNFRLQDSDALISLN